MSADNKGYANSALTVVSLEVIYQKLLINFKPHFALPPSYFQHRGVVWMRAMFYKVFSEIELEPLCFFYSFFLKLIFDSLSLNTQ